MSDILAEFKDSNGNMSNDKLPEAIDKVAAVIEKMQQTVEVTTLDVLTVLEQHVVSTNNYLAAQIMDLSNELTELWNFVGKIAGAKAHRPKNTDKDMEEMVLAMKFSRLMALYNLMRLKGGNESGIQVPGR